MANITVQVCSTRVVAALPMLTYVFVADFYRYYLMHVAGLQQTLYEASVEICGESLYHDSPINFALDLVQSSYHRYVRRHAKARANKSDEPNRNGASGSNHSNNNNNNNTNNNNNNSVILNRKTWQNGKKFNSIHCYQRIQVQQ